MSKKIMCNHGCFLIFVAILTMGGCSAFHSKTSIEHKQPIVSKDLEAERINELWWRAAFLQEMKKFEESKKAYHEVLSFKEQHLGSEHPELAVILNNLAFLNKSMGEYGKAKALYERALAIDEKACGYEHPDIAKDLGNLAGIYYVLGEYGRAKPLYERALAIDEKAYGYEHPDVAKDLSNLAGIYYAMGDYGRAKPLYERALAIDENAYGYKHPDVARDLNNLAELYRTLGEYDRAKSLYEQSLSIWEKNYDTDDINLAILLNNLAGLYCDLGKHKKAETFYERALSIYENAYGSEHPRVATVLNNMGGLYYAMGEYGKAKSLYERALNIDEKFYGCEHPSVSIRLNNLAEIYYVTGKYGKAEPLYERSLAAAQTSGQPELLWRVQLNLGYLLAKQENPKAAIFFAKESVNTIQSLRAGISVMGKDLQKSFFKTKWHVYEFLADLLIDHGRLPEAQQVLKMQKEEEYFDFLCRDTSRRAVRTTTATFTEEELHWSKHYNKIGSQMATMGQELAELKQKEKLGLTDEEKKHYQQLANDLNASLSTFKNCLVKLIDDLSSANKERYVGVKENQLDKLGKLQQVLRELGHGAVVIQYLITDDKLRIILTTTDSQHARDVDISSKELNHKIMAYREIMHNPRRPPLSQAQQLYKIILAPIDEDLKQAGAKTLMLSLDGSLRYLPVAALHDGEHYVAERYMLAIYTSAAGLDIREKPTERWLAGGLGLSRAVRNLDPLPNVPAELESIVRRDASDPDGVLPGVIYLDEAFSREALESVLADEYHVVHIATHFELKPGTKYNSCLVLGDGSPLTLAKIKDDDYDFGGIELLTLSACNTAVGATGENGREVESFGTLAQDQGARGVLATLWKVSDQSTCILMKNFYKLHAEHPDMTKAEALQYAQLQFIQGQVGVGNLNDKTRGMNVSAIGAKTEGEKVSLTPDLNSYSHPFYWAPFILMGNWL